MATFAYPYLINNFLALLLHVLAFAFSTSTRAATFLQGFRVTWSDSHIRQIEGGSTIQLVLDQNSGCGFASKGQYLFGRVSMQIKLIPGDSAGTVTAFYNNEARGIPYPKFQPMGVYSTLWEADDWATISGLEKIDWSKAPFYAFMRNFELDGCMVPGPSTCPSNPANRWEGAAYQQLNPIEARRYRWVRMNHMIYDYCSDKSRYPVTPPECVWLGSKSSFNPVPQIHMYIYRGPNLLHAPIHLPCELEAMHVKGVYRTTPPLPSSPGSTLEQVDLRRCLRTVSLLSLSFGVDN
ncbi:xyloglucan endotransglucosylase/hydrolase 7 [Actinidia rufa]|uniref:Xyloglucan endotransglucosylase/hydrolase n=1 Tax=Actinidia rufa TaxID=165716 RepID=A0A7J0EX54_9ERIC|nr:xyloglucan endotransglucosylase/hydrolase 7 [Actinidia rufa]